MPSQDLQVALERHFGFTAFRPGQEEAIRHVLAGRDTLVVMPTGAGKSLIFQLPALLLDGVTLVVSPLIALMKDQVDRLLAQGIPATYINSALSLAEQNACIRGMREGAYKLVYIAPERLRSAGFARALGRARIARLVVDEAHCISQWGHDFRPDYLRLRQSRPEMGMPPVVALTATATPTVQDDISHQLGMADPVRIVTGFNRANLHFGVRFAPDTSAKLRELQAMLTEIRGSIIVYVGTRRLSDEVADFVRRSCGITAIAYHAGLDGSERTRIQDAFMQGQIPIVVATNAFGMGIDKADIRAVIHYNLPGTVEAYYQEAGRAGRDGLPAQAVLFYAPDDRRLQEWFIENDAPNLEELERLYRLLRTAADGGLLRATLSEISRAVGLDEIKARVGISELERAGALVHLGDEMGQMALQVLPRRELDLSAIVSRLERHREHKRSKLSQMIAYAEGNLCRRRFVLDYFGDPGSAEAEQCCDNCLPRASPSGQSTRRAATEGEWIALVILETVRTLKWPVGRSRLAQILAGSRSKDIAEYGYDRHRFYGRLARFTRTRVQELVDQLIALRYLKIVGGDRPTVQLTPAGEAALNARAAIALNIPEVTKSMPGVSDTVMQSSVPPDSPAEPPIDPDSALLKALHTWRSSVARTQKVPPYIIFHDRVLKEIARRKPATLDQLYQIRGIGPRKLEAYGEQVIEIVKGYGK